MKLKPNIYVVDDDEAVRDSLQILLQSAGYAVRSFSSGTEFLEEAATLPNGCLIADLRMPEIDGLELQAQLTELKLRFPLIMITGHGDVPLAVRAMKAGAVDFVEKPFAPEAILNSIRLAFTRSDQAHDRSEAAVAAGARVALLSQREREVLDRLVVGMPNKTIAFELGISPRTVEIHRARVMSKMQARSLSELVRLALAAGVQIQSA
jgi:two-component system, LuxR family, response regulator FixJ